MYIHRELENQIIPFLKRREVISVIGPRQSGKTTLLCHLHKQIEESGKSAKFITFERRPDLELFQNDIEDFKNLHKNYDYVIIDEFQYAKDGGRKLKYLFDTSKIKFIISGSSSLELTFQVGKYMVGRIFNFRLYPFSFKEFLSFSDIELYRLLKEKIVSPKSLFPKLEGGKIFGAQINQRIEKNFEEYLVWGGYPAAALSKTKEEKQKILESIAENYLLKDIKGLLQMATDRELVRLAKFLAFQAGNLVEYKELSNASGLSYKPLLKHINVLKETFIIDIIRPFFTNKRTELTKNPKIYFIDNGLRDFLVSDFKPAGDRNDIGQLAENYVFNFLNKNLGPLEKLNFWRTKSGAEVDFVIEKNGKPFPVEVKYSADPVVGKSIYSFIDKFSPPEILILTKGFTGERKIKNSKVKFIPVYYL